jgi:hypothetical protein
MDFLMQPCARAFPRRFERRSRVGLEAMLGGGWESAKPSASDAPSAVPDLT